MRRSVPLLLLGLSLAPLPLPAQGADSPGVPIAAPDTQRQAGGAAVDTTRPEQTTTLQPVLSPAIAQGLALTVALLLGVGALVFLVGAGRGIAKGESFAVESHWGGFGGGLGGWRISAPLVHLVAGLALLLMLTLLSTSLLRPTEVVEEKTPPDSAASATRTATP